MSEPTPEYVQQLEARLRKLEKAVEILDDTVRDSLLDDSLAAAQAEEAQAADSRDEAAPFIPRFPSLESWVDEYFCRMFTRGPNTRWCPQWWDHGEAIARLNTLHRLYEAALINEHAWPGWWLQLDHHLSVLFDPRGPFVQCNHKRHLALPRLPHTPAPPGALPDALGG